MVEESWENIGRATPEMYGSMVKKAHDSGQGVNAWLLEVVGEAISHNPQ
ncbi:hypothetical protein [Desulfovibrio sp. TomC]|nr:hypothetical protein [Desulfovibrio sp. TomC]KHK01899.1 hypothetical protein NY78_2718 [Desulfovibrio sp. TomC]